MMPIRLGKPCTSMHHGKQVVRTWVYFPDGTRELMKQDRLEWTLLHGRPSRGLSVFRKDGELVCVPNSELSKINGKKRSSARSDGSRKGWTTRRWSIRAKATAIYLNHKPYPLAA